MNLLIDQGDQQNPQPFEEPRETPEAFNPISAEEPAPPLTLDTSADYYRYERGYAKKRNIVGPVIIIVLLVSIISAAAYFSFFYKAKEFPGYTPIAEKRPVVTDTATIQTKPISQTPSTTTTTPETAQPPGTKEISTTTSGEGHPLDDAARLLNEITLSAPEEVTINTVILDENSFSAEITSRSRSAIETFFAGLKSKTGGELSFSPSSGNYSEVRALLTGNFQPNTRGTFSPQAATDIAGSERAIRQIANDKGMKVLEISHDKARTSSGVTRVPLFVKVSGDIDSYKAFSSALAELLPEIKFSKIIVMFSSRQKATYVLRLESLHRY